MPLTDIAKLAAETTVVAEFGPDARVWDFHVDEVEFDTVTDGLVDARVRVSCRVDRPLWTVNVTFEVVDLP